MSLLLLLAVHAALIAVGSLLLPPAGHVLPVPGRALRRLRLLLRKQATLPAASTVLTEAAPPLILALSATGAILVPGIAPALPAGDPLPGAGLLLAAEAVAAVAALDSGETGEGLHASILLARSLPILPGLLLIGTAIGLSAGHGLGLSSALIAASILLLVAGAPLPPAPVRGGADAALVDIAGRLRRVAWLSLAAASLPPQPVLDGTAAGLLLAVLAWAAKLAALSVLAALGGRVAPRTPWGTAWVALVVAVFAALAALPHRAA